MREAGVVVNESITLGAAVVMAVLLLATAVSRWNWTPAGRHRSTRPAPVLVPVAELMGPVEAWLPCDSPRCGHLSTKHVETGEDEFACSQCGRVTGGAR